MKAYKIYNYERDVLVRQVMIDGTRYNPVPDHEGTYFITEREHKHCGLGKLDEFIPPKIEELV